jgi:hypothetical protein
MHRLAAGQPVLTIPERRGTSLFAAEGAPKFGRFSAHLDVTRSGTR